jgi:hypothetical protein
MKKVTNSKEEIRSREGSSCSTTQDIRKMLWNPKVCVCVLTRLHHSFLLWAKWIKYTAHSIRLDVI